MVEEESIFRSKAWAAVNLLKEDISIRIAEATSYAGILYQRLMCGGDLVTALNKFLQYFFQLYDATIEQRRKGQEARKFEEYFEDPYVYATNPGGKKVIDYKESAKKALNIHRKYKEFLRASGMLNLKTYDIRADQAFRESI